MDNHPDARELDAPRNADIRAALERILESRSLAGTRRMKAFLRFIVEEALAGKGERLKAFSIACEVYGRDESFDPRSDTIVRVEAGRLRRRLAEYYETEGRDDPVHIDVPKGGYTPAFDWREPVIPDPPVPASPSPTAASAPRRKKWVILAGTLLLAISVVIAGWYRSAQEQSTAPGIADVNREDTSSDSRVFLVILPFTTIANAAMETRLAEGLLEAIVTDLTKLSGLSVMAHASLMNLDSRSADLDALRREYGATHTLRGSLERQGDIIRVNVQLVDVLSGTTVWADRLDGKVEDLLGLQDALAQQIIRHLAVQISSQENTLLNQHHAENLEALALYRQALVLLMPPNEMERIITAQNMFQRVMDLDPTFGGGYAGKSFSHAVTVLFFNAADPDVELEKSIDLALTAIDIDPDFAMGYVSLAFAYAISGQPEQAVAYTRHAISIQPGDAFTQFIYGLSLTYSDLPREAMIPLSEAIRIDPAEPRTPYRNVLGIAYYLTNDYSTAAELFEENLQTGGPSGPHMDILRASTYAELGQEEKAKSIIHDLNQSSSGFPFENWLGKWVHNRDNLSRLMENLYRLGLPKESETSQ